MRKLFLSTVAATALSALCGAAYNSAARAGQRNFNSANASASSNSEASAYQSQEQSNTMNLFVVQPPVPPVPMEVGQECWHNWDVPSADDPKVHKTIAVYSCRPLRDAARQ